MTPESEEDTSHDVAPGPSRPRRVVIAEDHPAHLEALRKTLLKLRPTWEVCATANNATALLQAIDDHVPELLLLDVHLIKGTSFDALKRLPYPLPIVFISGDPTFAVDAYEFAAVDYVLKPVRPGMLERALSRVDARDHHPQQHSGEGATWFTARSGSGNSTVVHLDEVLFFQAQLKHTRVAMRDGDVILRRGLGMIERQLDREKFVRIHRSTVINIAYAGTLMRDDLGRLKLQLRGRSEWLFVSKPFERAFKGL